mgnify:CR=1 FL=1
MAGIAKAVTTLLSYPIGIYVSAMGVWRISSAPSPGGLVAGLLMLLAGLVVFPQGRKAVQVLLGKRMSTADALVFFMMCFGGSALLNILFG